MTSSQAYGSFLPEINARGPKPEQVRRPEPQERRLPAAAARYELPAAAARYEHLAGTLRHKTLPFGCAQGAHTRSCRVLSASSELDAQVQQQLLQMQLQLQQQQYQLELMQRQMYAPRVPAWSPWPRHLTRRKGLGKSRGYRW